MGAVFQKICGGILDLIVRNAKIVGANKLADIGIKGDKIAKIVRAIKPDEVQINTPLRLSPVRPLTRQELGRVQKSFEGMNFRSVYEAEKPKVEKVIGEKKVRRLKRVE